MFTTFSVRVAKGKAFELGTLNTKIGSYQETYESVTAFNKHPYTFDTFRKREVRVPELRILALPESEFELNILGKIARNRLPYQKKFVTKGYLLFAPTPYALCYRLKGVFARQKDCAGILEDGDFLAYFFWYSKVSKRFEYEVTLDPFEEEEYGLRKKTGSG